MDIVTLFCLLEGDDFQKSFPVKIDKYETIGYLKEAIKEKRKSVLLGVDAADLVLYCVSVRNRDNDSLEELYQKIDQGDDSLSEPETTDTISETFPSPLLRHIHVLVRAPSAAYDPPTQNYKSLYEELWGKAEEFSGIEDFTLEVPQVQHIQQGCGFQPKPVSLRLAPLIGTEWESKGVTCKILRTMNRMPGEMKSLLVRLEYERIERILQNAVSRKWSSSKSGHPSPLARLDYKVSGQPGIGKSYFLSYLLVRRLLNRQPTVYRISDSKCFLFDKQSKGRLVDATFLFNLADDVKRELWILTDQILEKSGWCHEYTPWFTVLAASPKDANFSQRWEEDRNVGVHYMNNWEWYEVFAAYSMENPDLTVEEIDSLYTTFECFGPVARTPLKSIPARSSEQEFSRCVKKYIADLDRELRDFIKNGGLNLEYAVSKSLHRMVLIQPSGTSSSYTFDIATRWVAHRMARRIPRPSASGGAWW